MANASFPPAEVPITPGVASMLVPWSPFPWFSSVDLFHELPIGSAALAELPFKHGFTVSIV